MVLARWAGMVAARARKVARLGPRLVAGGADVASRQSCTTCFDERRNNLMEDELHPFRTPRDEHNRVVDVVDARRPIDGRNLLCHQIWHNFPEFVGIFESYEIMCNIL